MSTRFLEDKINGVRDPLFQLDHISETNHVSQKNLVKLCREVHYMCWGN